MRVHSNTLQLSTPHAELRNSNKARKCGSTRRGHFRHYTPVCEHTPLSTRSPLRHRLSKPTRTTTCHVNNIRNTRELRAADSAASSRASAHPSRHTHNTQAHASKQAETRTPKASEQSRHTTPTHGCDTRALIKRNPICHH